MSSLLGRTVMDKVTVIGAGLTGAVTSALLRKELPEKCAIEMIDKSRGAGGRMATSRGPFSDGCSVDLGAQYITATPEYYEQHSSIYQELKDNGLLKPLRGKLEGDNRHSEDSLDFMTPAGASSLAKYFISKSGAGVLYGRQVVSCDIQDGRWKLTSTDGATSLTDCLILTMPVPQILGLTGTIKSLIDTNVELKERLAAVSYSSRFAQGLFYKPGTTIDLPWCAKYFKDDVVRFVAIDTAKREQDPARVGSSVVVHASVPFSLRHLEEDKETVCPEHLLPRVRHLVPELPPADAVKNHKWRFSQVHHGFEGSPGAVLVHQNPPVVLAGDAFTTASRFDGCVDSAYAAVASMKEASKL